MAGFTGIVCPLLDGYSFFLFQFFAIQVAWIHPSVGASPFPSDGSRDQSDTCFESANSHVHDRIDWSPFGGAPAFFTKCLCQFRPHTQRPCISRRGVGGCGGYWRDYHNWTLPQEKRSLWTCFTCSRDIRTIGIHECRNLTPG